MLLGLNEFLFANPESVSTPGKLIDLSDVGGKNPLDIISTLFTTTVGVYELDKYQRVLRKICAVLLGAWSEKKLWDTDPLDKEIKLIPAAENFTGTGDFIRKAIYYL